jgi:hypothetical protein
MRVTFELTDDEQAGLEAAIAAMGKAEDADPTPLAMFWYQLIMVHRSLPTPERRSWLKWLATVRARFHLVSYPG